MKGLDYNFLYVTVFEKSYEHKSSTRDLVDSLCRDGTHVQYMNE